MENLIIGIIAEGPSDHAVITNILEGTLGININTQIQYLVPQLSKDKTDRRKSEQNILSFSGWTVVRKQCIDKGVIDDFFEVNPLAENLALVIQIDTAERFDENYEVTEPRKSNDNNYSENLRENIIAKIDAWLEMPYENIFYAVAIEETDAWVLALHEKKNVDTSVYEDPKKVYNKFLNHKQRSKKERNILKIKDAFKRNMILSSKLATNKGLRIARTKNKSLDLFCISLEEGLQEEE